MPFFILSLLYPGRSPLGQRGLKFARTFTANVMPGRSPLGLRGLKFTAGLTENVDNWSQPTRAAWIEIRLINLPQPQEVVSQPTRAAWIEIFNKTYNLYQPAGRSPLGLRGLKLICFHAITSPLKSQPTRAAWIEMPMRKYLP